MRLYLWLLVLPWMVVVSTQPPERFCRDSTGDCRTLHIREVKYLGYKTHLFGCVIEDDPDCSWVDDIAESLNSAHDRRMQPSVDYGIRADLILKGPPPCNYILTTNPPIPCEDDLKPVYCYKKDKQGTMHASTCGEDN